MGPRPHLCFFAFKTGPFGSRITRLYGSHTSPMSFCCMRNSDWLAPEILSFNGSQHLTCRFVHSKQRLYDQNQKSLWVPVHTFCGFVHAKQLDFRTRITSLYGSQTAPLVLCIQNKVISIRITSLYGSQTSSMVFAGKTATFVSELQVSMGPRHRLLICGCETAQIASRIYGYPSVQDLSCRFVHAKQRD